MSEDLAPLARTLVEAARAGRVTFALAESCTGGLIAHLVTDVPGASEVFLGGWVLYDNRRKVEDLGVDPRLIERHGAVSDPVAVALALAARRKAGADYAVATTGIAGPSGASQDKPVGLVHIGVAAGETSEGHRMLHPDQGRSANKRAFAAHALRLLLQAVESG